MFIHTPPFILKDTRDEEESGCASRILDPVAQDSIDNLSGHVGRRREESAVSENKLMVEGSQMIHPLWCLVSS